MTVGGMGSEAPMGDEFPMGDEVSVQPTTMATTTDNGAILEPSCTAILGITLEPHC